jgi:hypothetical protein
LNALILGKPYNENYDLKYLFQGKPTTKAILSIVRGMASFA